MKTENIKIDCNRAATTQQAAEPKIVPCKICGKPVEPYFFDGRMCRKYHHDECVLSEALQAVSDGCGFKDKRIRRAHNLLGYTLKELREEVHQG